MELFLFCFVVNCKNDMKLKDAVAKHIGVRFTWHNSSFCHMNVIVVEGLTGCKRSIWCVSN